MKQFCNSVLVFLITTQVAFSQVRTVQELDVNWKFQKGINNEAFQVNFDDSKWETVTVPHDWAIYGPFDKEVDKQSVAIVQNGEEVASEKTGRTGALPHIGTAWYRNKFTVRQYKKGKKVILLFEGAMSEPQVYLNGKKVGEWAYGYSYFYFDVSEFIQDGENTLAVEVSNKEFASRWYPGAGLYRKVSVIVKNKESINQWGTTITTPIISDEFAKVNIKTEITIFSWMGNGKENYAEKMNLLLENSTIEFLPDDKSMWSID